MEDQVMDRINIIIMAVYVLVISLYCFYYSYRILVMGKEYIYPHIRFRIFLIKIFTGHSKAMSERQKYSSPEIVHQSGKQLFIAGLMSLIMAILYFLILNL